MLLSNTNEIKMFVPVSTGLSFEALTPFIDTVEENCLKPLIGEALYERLEASYDGTLQSGSADDENALAKALYLSQKVIANLALYEGFTLIGINFSDKGGRRSESDTERTLYKYQEDEAKERLKNTGYDTLDTLIAYLEEYIEYFPDFMGTDTYGNLKSSLIKNTSVFHSVYNINNSRLVFLKLKPFIDQAIDLDLIPVIGQELYDETIMEIKKISPAEKITALLPYLQKPVVFLAVERGIKTLGISILDKGIVFLKSATNSPSMRQEQITDQNIAFLAHDAGETGSRYMERLKQYLVTNTETYTTYSGQTGSVYRRDNTDKKTLFM